LDIQFAATIIPSFDAPNKKRTMSRILFLGTFPPPLHGMSFINQALCERLLDQGVEIEILDTSPTSLKRDYLTRLSRGRRIIAAWSQLLKADNKRAKLYIALSGGWGQVYDILSLALARAKRMGRIIHHHSFAYLHHKRWLTSLLFFIAGRESIHILLCTDMEHLIRAKYGVHKTLLLSNLAFSLPDIRSRERREVRAVGFLSNVTTEKGADEIIALAYSLHENMIPVRMIVAGPCLDSSLEKRLRSAEKDGVLVWRGGVYGMDKTRFWREIDVFIFPTRYKNEAEPLVVLEALAAGLPVITYQRGCISEQVGEAGIVIPADDDFIQSATSVLRAWKDTPEEYQYYVRRTDELYRDLFLKAEIQWKELLLEIEAGNQ
jgi:glycosyltransferase involved in cell wall biosynthesis